MSALTHCHELEKTVVQLLREVSDLKSHLEHVKSDDAQRTLQLEETRSREVGLNREIERLTELKMRYEDEFMKKNATIELLRSTSKSLKVDQSVQTVDDAIFGTGKSCRSIVKMAKMPKLAVNRNVQAVKESPAVLGKRKHCLELDQNRKKMKTSPGVNRLEVARCTIADSGSTLRQGLQKLMTGQGERKTSVTEKFLTSLRSRLEMTLCKRQKSQTSTPSVERAHAPAKVDLDPLEQDYSNLKSTLDKLANRAKPNKVSRIVASKQIAKADLSRKVLSRTK